MKIKISRSQWEEMGRVGKWLVEAQRCPSCEMIVPKVIAHKLI